MKKTIIIIALFLLASCKEESQSSVQNGNFEVEFLFEHDGCKVYRFTDARTVYFSDCRGKTDYEYRTQAGKTTQTHQQETLNN